MDVIHYRWDSERGVFAVSHPPVLPSPMRCRFIVARGCVKWALRKMQLVALVTPWRNIYILSPWLRCPVVRRHELVHIEQIERDGAFWFSVKYVWWLLRYGYRQNPYEVEAYARQHEDG